MHLSNSLDLSVKEVSKLKVDEKTLLFLNAVHISMHCSSDIIISFEALQ